MRDRHAAVEGDEPSRQQAQRPAGMPLGRGTAGKGNQVGLLYAIERARRGDTGRMMDKCRLDTLGRTPRAHARDGRFTDLDGDGNRRVTFVRAARPFVRFEEDAGMREGARRSRPAVEHLL